MTEAQRKWLQANPGWELQKPGEQGGPYSQAGLVDRDGNFSLVAAAPGANVFRLPNGAILVGIPA